MDVVKSSHKNIQIVYEGLPYIPKLIIKEIICFFIGVLSSQANVFGQLTPFSTAFSAALPSRYCISVVLGASVGCLTVSPSSTAIHSIASMAAAAVLNVSLSKYNSFRESRVVMPAVSSLCCLITGLTIMIATNFSLNNAILFISESILAGGTTYFIMRAIRIRPLKDGGYCLNVQEAASVIIMLCVLLISGAELSIKGISPARILGVILVLSVAGLAKETGGSIAGICAGASLGFTAQMDFVAIFFGLGGLISGIFSNLGALATAGAFAGVCGIGALILSDKLSATVFIEVLFGCAVYLAIPQKLFEKVKHMIVAMPVSIVPDSQKNTVIMRLGTVSNAVTHVSERIEQVSEGLNKLSEKGSDIIFSKVKDSVCYSCTYRISCWNEGEEESYKGFCEIINLLNANERLTTDTLPSPFNELCIRSTEFISCFNKAYMSHIAKKGADEKVSQMRKIVWEQFRCLSEIINSISIDMKEIGKFDTETAMNASNAIELFDIHVIAASCLVSEQGNSNLYIQIPRIEQRFNRTKLARAVSSACNIEFNIPSVSECGEGLLLSFAQRYLLKTRLGAVQISGNNSEYCGDFFECFDDGRGHQVLLISDGMGTGGRAAIDSALTTEVFSNLLKAGLSYDCALRLANSALIVKGDDETISTLDVASIDLYSGKTEFFKAGGAASFVRRGNKVGTLELSAMPAGILRDIKFSRATTELSDGDIILMVSDGVIGEDSGWIVEELKNWRGTSAQKLSERISEIARNMNTEKNPDDMTVVCAIIE